MSDTFNKIHLIRQVDLFTLQLFMTVVEEGQIGRAATRENIAASAATKRIQDLEEIVGVALFERNPRGVVPTAAGMVLARHLAQVFGTFEEIRRDIGEFSEGVRGSVRMASTGGVISAHLSRDIAEFARGFPLVDIDLREGNNPEVIRILAAGEVDIAVFTDTQEVPADEIERIDYRSDHIVAVVPQGHALAGRPHVKLVELLEHNLIAIAPATSIMGHVRRTAALAGVEFKPKYSVSSVYAAMGLVRVSQGVTLQPDSMVSRQDLEWVRMVPLDEPWATRRLVVGVRRGRSLSVAEKNFVAQITARRG